MSLQKTAIDRKDQLPVYGLGLFMLLAGLSKFLILDFWLGYEPQFIVDFLPIAARQLTLIGGGFETALGISLLSGRKMFYVAGLTALWLLAISVQVASLGLWGLAIRDIGLVLYAMSVTLWSKSSSI